MRKYYILTILLSISFLVQAQFTVSYSLGYSSYDMSGMRKLLSTIQNTQPAVTIGAKNVDNFPVNNIFHSIDIGYKFNMHEFGLKGSGYNSTGGKLSIKDYSGEYSNKFIVNGFRAGFFYKNYFYNFKSDKRTLFSFFGEVSPGLYFTEIKNNGFFIVQDKELDSFNNIYKVNSFALLIQTGVIYYIAKNISANVTVGYDFVSKAEVNDFTPIPASVNWSSVKFMAGLGFSF